MKDAANLEHVRICADKEESVVTNAQPKFFSPLESLHVAYARFRKAMQRGENMHGGGLAQAADIGPGWTWSKRSASLRFRKVVDFFLCDSKFGEDLLVWNTFVML